MKKIISILSVVFVLFCLAGCETVKEIPNDLSAAQLIQKGQDSYGAGNYDAAELYYKAVIDRFGTNTNIYIEAKYELGHLYLKTKDYTLAEEAFNTILDIYSYDVAGELPPSYKKLALIGLSKIPEDKRKN